MSKLNKPEYVADKIRDSLKIEANKPDKINVNLGSPITPLQNQPSGLTTSTSSFTSSSSSGSVTGHASHSTRTYCRAVKPKKTQSTAQSGSSNDSLKSTARNIRPGQHSVLDKTGKTSVLSNQHVKKLPTGNLVPSGKVRITDMMTQEKPRSMMIRPNDKSYGYGNIMRGNNLSPATMSGGSSLIVSSPAEVEDTYWKIAIYGSNPEEVKRIGNEMFKKGCFNEALKLYDRAIQLSPTNPYYRTNRAAALSNLDQIGEAVKECEKAIKLNPKFARAHHRLSLLFLRLGCVDNAWIHLYSVEKTYDPTVVKIFEKVDKHLDRCRNARRAGEWNIVLTEVGAAMESGADSSPQLAMCKVEALLKLLRLDDAQRVLEAVPKVEPFPASISQARFFDMISEAYISFVKSQMELALGRFENAVTIAEKASDIDPHNNEVRTLYKNVRSIARERDRGNHLYELERYSEASSAYGEGLKYEPYNATLLCCRAECLYKVGMWESSIKDCNHALFTLPSYTMPRLQRAASYSKLERWAEAVSDYEFLRKKLPYDKEIAESLFHAQIALRKSRGEIVLNMEFGCEVEEITSLEELKSALTRPGVSVVHFCRASDQQCKEMSSFMDDLCVRYPSLHFLKVEIDKCPEVGDAEKVRVVPTFKIYKLGVRMKEIVCPSKEALEKTVRHYCL